MIRIGDVLHGRFEVKDVGVEGAQSVPFIATDLETQADVVVLQLKMPTKGAHQELSLAQAERASRLEINHPRVLVPTMMFKEDGAWYSVVPFCDGPTIDALCAAKGGRLDPDTAARITSELAEALAAIHAAGVVHRDIKPGNIIVHPDEGAKVIDFGICRVIGEDTLTGNPDILGTLPYIAPEQAECPTEVDGMADMFSVGAVLFLMLTGTQHMEVDSVTNYVARLTEPPPVRPRDLDPSIPADLDGVCMRLLARDPQHRIPSAEDLLRELRGRNARQVAGPVTCGGCGQSSQADKSFCARCGAALNGSSMTSVRCLGCGTASDGAPTCPGCGRSFGSEEHQLIFRRGAASSARFRIPQGIYVVGRDQICPRDIHISGRQFSVACLNGTVQVEDGGSVNKTFVGDQPAGAPVSLEVNHEIRFAGHVAVYIHI